jgi:tetratricopeptide (TPR) repeat protein
MKRAALVCAILAIASLALAQAGSGNQSQNQPAGKQSGQSGASAGQQGTSGQTAAPAAEPQGKRPPQAKTQPEFDAFNAATKNTDPAALEKAADDFAAKFPDSELRLLLYKAAMRGYQNANDADKMLDMGRKCLTFDPNDPEALIDVAEVLTERTRDTDLDKDQRLDEATKAAQKAITTVDTDVAFPAGTSQDKVDQYKGMLRSSAYSVLGALDFNKNNFTGAESNFRKSIDAFPQQPDAVTVLRLSLALDRQGKYPEALTFANKAVDMTQEGSGAGPLARRERDRLLQLTGGKPAGAAPASATGSSTTPPTAAPPKQ